jgi:hypothetical protein
VQRSIRLSAGVEPVHGELGTSDRTASVHPLTHGRQTDPGGLGNGIPHGDANLCSSRYAQERPRDPGRTALLGKRQDRDGVGRVIVRSPGHLAGLQPQFEDPVASLAGRGAIVVGLDVPRLTGCGWSRARSFAATWRGSRDWAVSTPTAARSAQQGTGGS